MDKEQFTKYVESTRDCDAVRLDTAVQKGLRRAKGHALDLRKLFTLTTACAVTAALCFAANTALIKAAADGYFRDRAQAMQISGEALSGYAAELADTIIKYLGDG